MFESIWQDVRQAARSLHRAPAFAAVVVLTLALGIGANTAIFSLMDAVMFRPLAVPAPEELSLLYDEGPTAPGDLIGGNTRGDQFSWPLVQQLEHMLPSGVRLAAMTPPTRLNARLGTDATTTVVLSELVSGSFFATFGATPTLGRLLTEDDNRTLAGHPVAVVGYDFWQRQLGGGADVIGRTLPLNGVPFTIVGVANRGFTGIWGGSTIQVWVPLLMQPAIAYRQNASSYSAQTNDPWPPQPGVFWLNLVTRSRPEQREAIRTAFASVRDQQVREVAGDSDRELLARVRWQGKVGSFARGFSVLRDRSSQILVLLMALVGLLLTAACANVANLLLARAAARQREFGIRMSLGAGRSHFIRYLVVESLLLSLVGGLAAVLVAQWASTSLASFARVREVLPPGFALDTRVLAFCLVISVATGLVFGLFPALRVTRAPLAGSLRVSRTAAGDARAMRPLVVAQIALSLVLVISAGLFGRSLQKLWSINPGYDREHLVQIRLNPRVGGVRAEELPALYARITDRARQVPGVVAAEVSYCGIASGCRSISGIRVEGYQPGAGEIPRFLENRVGSTYFTTTGMPILEGRALSDRDAQAQQQVVVINEAAARKYFGNASPIGRRIGYGGELTTEIVGVVRDARVNTLREAPVPMAFYPINQPSERQFATAMDVRVRGDATVVGETVRRAVAAIEPRLLADARPVPVAEQLDQGLTRDRLVAYLAGAFGALALVLACIGLYGVLSYAVATRTSELGVRMALGSTPAGVLRLVIGDGMRVTTIGILIGIAAAVLGTRYLQTLLFGVTPTDRVTYGTVVVTLVVVALLASFLPARRAARVDPVTALRAE